jgi:hypothetical protein
MDRVDHFHALDRRADQLLGELLVIERFHAAAEDKRIFGLFDLQLAQGIDLAVEQDRLGQRGQHRPGEGLFPRAGRDIRGGKFRNAVVRQ